MEWLKLKVLAGLRWVGNAFVSVWNMHVDPPAKLFKYYFFACFSLFLAGGVAAIWLFGPKPIKIPAADRFVSSLPTPAKPVPVEVTVPGLVIGDAKSDVTVGNAPALAPVVINKAPVVAPAKPPKKVAKKRKSKAEHTAWDWGF